MRVAVQRRLGRWRGRRGRRRGRRGRLGRGKWLSPWHAGGLAVHDGALIFKATALLPARHAGGAVVGAVEAHGGVALDERTRVVEERADTSTAGGAVGIRRAMPRHTPAAAALAGARRASLAIGAVGVGLAAVNDAALEHVRRPAVARPRVDTPALGKFGVGVRAVRVGAALKRRLTRLAAVRRAGIAVRTGRRARNEAGHYGSAC